MWIVTLTPSSTAVRHGAQPAVIKVFSNSVDDLFYGSEIRMPVLQRMMDRGLIAKLEIDFKPSLSGVRRIERVKVRENGILITKFVLTVDKVLASGLYDRRADAWAVGEQ